MLNELDVEDHWNFEFYNPEEKNISCFQTITKKNFEKCVKLRGLSWGANKSNIIDFFEGFNLSRDNITIDV